MLFTRTSNKKYVVGFDLGDEECQISYSESGQEPVTFSVVDGKEEFGIPTVLTKKLGANIWFCGREAIERAARGDGTKIRHILSSAIEGRAVMIEGQEYDPASLLALYVRRVLALISGKVPTYDISVLMFTLDTMDERAVAALEKVRDFLSLPFDGMYWENRENSFFSYMLQQNDSLHEKDVLLCRYDGENAMLLERLCYNTGTTPVAVYVKREECREMCASLTAPNRRDETFLHVLKDHVKEGEISSVFLIGAGFAGEPWMKESLRYLAYHRRVFLGNNLFSKGAAISAMLRREHRSVQDRYFFLGENCLTYNLGLMVLRGGRNTYYPVLDAGASWYEVKESMEFMIDGTADIHIVLTPLTGGKVREEVMELTGLPKRPDRTVRIAVRFEMKDVHILTVRAEDVGFGEITPSSGLTWDRDIELV